MTTEHVTAADGARIAYRSGGQGDAVLFVHGTIASSSDWVFVARLLRDRHTVVTMDRRGRGASDFGAEAYSLDQEADDVAAVAAATNARAVVGHSYGGLCTMRALERGLDVDRVTLYEPPASIPAGTFGDDHPIFAAVEDGDGETAAAGFLALADATDDELALVRASPAWPSLVQAAPTLRRELTAAQDWTTPAGPFEMPALLLVGGDTTSPGYLDGIPAIEAAFPHLRRRELPGQKHLAHVMAAEAFAAAVGEFLEVGGAGFEPA